MSQILFDKIVELSEIRRSFESYTKDKISPENFKALLRYCCGLSQEVPNIDFEELNSLLREMLASMRISSVSLLFRSLSLKRDAHMIKVKNLNALTTISQSEALISRAALNLQCLMLEENFAKAASLHILPIKIRGQIFGWIFMNPKTEIRSGTYHALSNPGADSFKPLKHQVIEDCTNNFYVLLRDKRNCELCSVPAVYLYSPVFMSYYISKSDLQVMRMLQDDDDLKNVRACLMEKSVKQGSQGEEDIFDDNALEDQNIADWLASVRSKFLQRIERVQRYQMIDAIKKSFARQEAGRDSAIAEPNEANSGASYARVNPSRIILKNLHFAVRFGFAACWVKQDSSWKLRGIRIIRQLDDDPYDFYMSFPEENEIGRQISIDDYERFVIEALPIDEESEGQEHPSKSFDGLFKVAKMRLIKITSEQRQALTDLLAYEFKDNYGNVLKMEGSDAEIKSKVIIPIDTALIEEEYKSYFEQAVFELYFAEDTCDLEPYLEDIASIITTAYKTYVEQCRTHDAITKEHRMKQILAHYHHIILSNIMGSCQIAIDSENLTVADKMIEYVRARGRYLNRLAKEKSHKFKEYDLCKDFIDLGLFVGNYLFMLSSHDNWEEGLKSWRSIFEVTNIGSRCRVPGDVIDTILENLVYNSFQHGFDELYMGLSSKYRRRLQQEGRLPREQIKSKSRELAQNDIIDGGQARIYLHLEYRDKQWELRYTDSGIGFLKSDILSIDTWSESESGKGFGWWCIGEAIRSVSGKFDHDDGVPSDKHYSEESRHEDRYNPTFIFRGGAE